MKKLFTLVCVLSISLVVQAQETRNDTSLVFEHDRLRTQNAERALLNKAIVRLAEQKNKVASDIHTITLPDSVYLKTTDNEICRVFIMDSPGHEFTTINCEFSNRQVESGLGLIVEYDRVTTEKAERALVNKAVVRLEKQNGKIATDMKSVLLPNTVYLKTTDNEICRVFMMDSPGHEFTTVNCEK